MTISNCKNFQTDCNVLFLSNESYKKCENIHNRINTLIDEKKDSLFLQLNHHLKFIIGQVEFKGKTSERLDEEIHLPFGLENFNNLVGGVRSLAQQFEFFNTCMKSLPETINSQKAYYTQALKELESLQHAFQKGTISSLPK